jgi:hypothetical protein
LLPITAILRRKRRSSGPPCSRVSNRSPEPSMLGSWGRFSGVSSSNSWKIFMRLVLFVHPCHCAPVRLGRVTCSCQFGRASAPTIPQRVQTMLGRNAGTGTSSGPAARVIHVENDVCQENVSLVGGPAAYASPQGARPRRSPPGAPSPTLNYSPSSPESAARSLRLKPTFSSNWSAILIHDLARSRNVDCTPYGAVAFAISTQRLAYSRQSLESTTSSISLSAASTCAVRRTPDVVGTTSRHLVSVTKKAARKPPRRHRRFRWLIAGPIIQKVRSGVSSGRNPRGELRLAFFSPKEKWPRRGRGRPKSNPVGRPRPPLR